MPVVKNVHYTHDFALFDKTGLDYDSRLTWDAKGILSYILAKPRNWEINVTDLINRSVDGKTVVYSALKELRHFGYVTYREEKDTSGYIQCCYYVYATPDDNPQREDPATIPLGKLHQGIDKRKKYAGGYRKKKRIPVSENLNGLGNQGEPPYSENLNGEVPVSENLNTENLNVNKNNESIDLTNNNPEEHQNTDFWHPYLTQLLPKLHTPDDFRTWIEPLDVIDGTGTVVLRGDLMELSILKERHYDVVLREVLGKPITLEVL